MPTELDRARSLADGFVGPKCKGVGYSGPSIVFASKPTPGCIPWDSPSETIWALWGEKNIVRLWLSLCQFARHISLRTSPCLLVFEPSKCPSASTETRRSVKEEEEETEEFEEECWIVRRRTERRQQQQRGGKFQRASLMFFSYTRINCRYGLALYISQSNNNHFKHKPVVHFSAFVDLATEISAILPLWRLKLSVYFHLGEYYRKDFSSPEEGKSLI